jgi:hypothetical protein
MRYWFIIITVILFAPVGFVAAQLPGVDLANLTISPQNPGPNQTVTARLDSNATDINRADISWSVNGETKSSGKGLKTFTFQTGDLGAKTTLEVLMISAEGYPWTKSITLTPAKVALLIEAESYTPPFYRGKAYFPYQGRARVTAVPSFVDENGKQIPPEQLVFKWKQGTQNMIDSSGLGKNILTYRSGVLIRANSVSVEVSSLDQQYVANASVNITPVEPKTILYENNPEYGILYNKALSDPFSLKATEITVTAVPYFFTAASSNDSNLKYDWNLNGTAVGNGGNSIVLHNPGGGGGRALLSLQLSNTVDYFQFANASLNINFGQAAKNLFGL